MSSLSSENRHAEYESSDLNYRLYGYLIASLLSTADEPFLNFVPVIFIKVVATCFLIPETPNKHMIDSYQDRIRNSQEGTLSPNTCFDTMIEGG